MSTKDSDGEVKESMKQSSNRYAILASEDELTIFTQHIEELQMEISGKDLSNDDKQQDKDTKGDENKNYQKNRKLRISSDSRWYHRIMSQQATKQTP